MEKELPPIEKRQLGPMPDLSLRQRSDLFFACRRATTASFRRGLAEVTYSTQLLNGK